MEVDMKKCPICAEEIKKEAKKCRYCWADQVESENKERFKEFFEYISKKKYYVRGISNYLKFVKIEWNVVFLEYKEGKMSFLIFFILILFWILPWILYLIYCAFRNNWPQVWTVTLSDEGIVLSTEWIKKEFFWKYNNQIKNKN